MREVNVVRPLGLQSDAMLLARGDDGSFDVLFERHVAHVSRVLARILGSDADLPDLINEVFVVVHNRAAQGAAAERFRGWLTGLCVNVARNRLRSRRRGRWLVFGEPELDTLPASDDSDEREALAATYRVLGGMDENLRICFALRFIDGRELAEIADACGVSLATIKRWLVRAEAQFLEGARGSAVLVEWLQTGSRWGGGAA